MTGQREVTGQLTNWAGNVTFSAERFRRPASVGELQRLVASGRHVRALGTGHSFSTVADCRGDLVSVAGLPKVIEIDSGRATVTVSPGLRYGELAGRLDEAGWALRNLGSLPHISIAGACATGTHGSGDANGNLATAVSALEMVTADGDIVAVSRERDGEEFAGTVVALGTLGIVSSLTLDLVPAFRLRQDVYEGLPGDQRDEHLAEILASGYSVSVFTRWRGDRISQVWVKRLAGEGDSRAAAGRVSAAAGRVSAAAEPSRWLGATLADGPRHPVPGMPAGYTTPQLGAAGPWHERLPHFRLEFTPSNGEELQSEYLVPRDRAVEALAAIDGIRDQVAPVLQISEIRSVAADNLWLSPSYLRPTVAIHFTWIKDPAAVIPVLAAIEDRLAPLRARPHWGKLFNVSPDAVRGLYERLPDFERLRGRYDPAGKFGNEFTDIYVPASR
ncbi:MAG: FAD-binding protein [Streptosporangiaceae bacterium]